MKISTPFLILSVSVAILSLQISSGLAANSVNVNFKGNLIQNPPCEITGIDGNQITVDFSDMVIRKITGKTYIQEVKYKLTCDAPDNTGISLTMKGTPSDFNASLLTTSNANLGISFYASANYYPIRVNVDPIKFPNNSHDPIYANPVIKTGATNVATGSFTATATILAEYQ